MPLQILSSLVFWILPPKSPRFLFDVIDTSIPHDFAIDTLDA